MDTTDLQSSTHRIQRKCQPLYALLPLLTVATHTQTQTHTEAGEVQNDNKGYLWCVFSFFCEKRWEMKRTIPVHELVTCEVLTSLRTERDRENCYLRTCHQPLSELHSIDLIPMVQWQHRPSYCQGNSRPPALCTMTVMLKHIDPYISFWVLKVPGLVG